MGNDIIEVETGEVREKKEGAWRRRRRHRHGGAVVGDPAGPCAPRSITAHLHNAVLGLINVTEWRRQNLPPR